MERCCGRRGLRRIRKRGTRRGAKKEGGESPSPTADYETAPLARRICVLALVCACGLWRGGFCVKRRCRRGGRRATYTSSRPFGRGASVRRKREVLWAWVCVFCRR